MMATKAMRFPSGRVNGCTTSALKRRGQENRSGLDGFRVSGRPIARLRVAQ